MSDRFESRRPGTVSEADIGMLFEQRAARADESGLAASVLAGIIDTRQTRAWRSWLPRSFGSAPTLVRVGALLMVAILAITVAFAAAGVSPPREVTEPTNAVRPSNVRTEPTNEVVLPSGVPTGLFNDGVRPSGPPTGVVDDLIRHFEYTVSPGTKLSGPVTFGNTIVQWSSGSFPRGDQDSLAAQVGVQRGIIVASADTPWSHGPKGRTRLRSAPYELLADLHDVAFVPLGPVSEISLDGHAALVVLVPYPGANDLHFSAKMEGLSGPDFIDLKLPSRLIVEDVDGLTILIDVWARTPDDLTAWLPKADEFIRSIHFLAPDETPAGS